MMGPKECSVTLSATLGTRGSTLLTAFCQCAEYPKAWIPPHAHLLQGLIVIRTRHSSASISFVFPQSPYSRILRCLSWARTSMTDTVFRARALSPSHGFAPYHIRVAALAQAVSHAHALVPDYGSGFPCSTQPTKQFTKGISTCLSILNSRLNHSPYPVSSRTSSGRTRPEARPATAVRCSG